MSTSIARNAFRCDDDETARSPARTSLTPFSAARFCRNFLRRPPERKVEVVVCGLWAGVCWLVKRLRLYVYTFEASEGIRRHALEYGAHFFLVISCGGAYLPLAAVMKCFDDVHGLPFPQHCRTG